jgi:ribonuclease Y
MMAVAAGGFLLGGLAALFVSWLRERQRLAKIELAQNTAARIIEEAKKEANVIKKEAEVQARDSVLQAKLDFEKEIRETRKELQAQERRVLSKEEGLEKRGCWRNGKET